MTARRRDSAVSFEAAGAENAGVRLSDGMVLTSDLLVDATGPASLVPWVPPPPPPPPVPATWCPLKVRWGDGRSDLCPCTS